MQLIENYIYNLENEQKAIVSYLHNLLLGFNLVPKIRYKVPFYFNKSWVCYINTIKKTNAIELAFLRGNELSNHQNMLDFKKRKQVAGITFNSIKETENDLIVEIINEAILLDANVPYKNKKQQNL